MTEKPQSEGAPSPDETLSPDVAEELRNLGENLKSIFHSAWESEERKQFQQEVETGLEDVAASINQAMKDFKESKTGQQLKSDLENLQERVKSGEVESKAREELLSALRKINEELKKLTRQQGDSP